MKIELYNILRVRTGSRNVLQFFVDDVQSHVLANILRNEKEKNPDMRYDIFMYNERPRTKGWRSQNHRINGHCQQIAQETGNSFRAIKEHMKKEAIDRGYPFETLPDGSTQPKSEADISVEEAILLTDTINQFAAEWGIVLKEYID